MKKGLATLCFFMVAIGACLAQATVPASPAPVVPVGSPTQQAQAGLAQERLSIATSSEDYPVTPSDLYTLTYRRATGDVLSQPVQVANDYSVDIGTFGKIDAHGMTFAYLKQRVEGLIDVSYARSYPSLTILTVGVFRVALSGDIAHPRFMSAWGLSRLSELFEEAGEPGTSLRSVGLRPREGLSKSFDLLKYRRMGDESQNPIVQPDDTITLIDAKTAIKLGGEVRQPGSYELIPQEGLRDLIEKFGGGLSDFAETSRVRIDRMTANGPTAQYIALSKAYDQPIGLEGCIAVSIPSKMDNRPFVWFEGAVTASASTTSAGASQSQIAAASVSVSAKTDAGTPAAVGERNRISLQIYEGEMLSDALREMRNSLSQSADLSSATLFRNGSAAPMAVDLQPLQAMANPPTDLMLQANDRIYIPSLRSTITVNGAVFAGGSFTYQLNSPASYYIGQAGGIDPERNGNGLFWVLDQNGKRRKATDILLPGDRIYVPTNSFTYNLVRYTPVVSGIISLVLVVVPFVQTYIIK